MRRKDACGNANERCQNHGRQPQFHRHGQALDQNLRNGSPEADGIAQIAAQNVAHIARKLHGNRLIQPKFPVEAFARLLRRFLAEHGRAWVARNHPCQREGHEQDGKENGNGV